MVQKQSGRQKQGQVDNANPLDVGLTSESDSQLREFARRVQYGMQHTRVLSHERRQTVKERIQKLKSPQKPE